MNSEDVSNLKEDYVYDSVLPIVLYILSKGERFRTNLRLNKTMYLLFAYYSASYGNLPDSEREGIIESELKFPKYLFPAEFEAWTYGPVINEVVMCFRNGVYDLEGENLLIENSVQGEIKSFIDDMIDQISDIGDWDLLSRTKQDQCWKNNYTEGSASIIPVSEIKSEYIERYI